MSYVMLWSKQNKYEDNPAEKWYQQSLGILPQKMTITVISSQNSYFSVIIFPLINCYLAVSIALIFFKVSKKKGIPTAPFKAFTKDRHQSLSCKMGFPSTGKNILKMMHVALMYCRWVALNRQM